MSRCEVIHMISDLDCVKNKTAENHFDYLVREKRLPELNGFGRTIVAQPTNNRSMYDNSIPTTEME